MLTVNGKQINNFSLESDNAMIGDPIQDIRRAKELYAVYGKTRVKLPTKGSAKALAGCIH